MPVPYIIIKDETVVYSGMGDIIPEEAIVLESPYEGALDIPVNWLHADYTPKTEVELIQDGIKDLPYHYKIENGELVPFSEEDISDEEEIARCKQRLNDTDWYVMRSIDTGEAIPSDIKKERKELREKISKINSKSKDKDKEKKR